MDPLNVSSPLSSQQKLQYLKSVSQSYRELWATFDLPLIILGIVSMVNACLLQICFVYGLMRADPTKASSSQPVANGCGNHSASNENSTYRPYVRTFWIFSLAFAIVTILTLCGFHNWKTNLLLVVVALFTCHLSTDWPKYLRQRSNWFHLTLLLPAVLHGCISASNSFILGDPHCLVFLSNVVVVCIVVYAGKSSQFKFSSTLYAFVLITACCLLSREFVTHPESDQPNYLLEPLSSLDGESAYTRCILSAVGIFAFVLLTVKNLHRSENLIWDEFSLTSFWFIIALPLSAFFIILYWLLGLQSHAEYESQSDLVKVLFPRITYLVVVIAMVLFICDPTMVFVKCLRPVELSLSDFNSTDPTKVIPQLAKSLFSNEHPQGSANRNGVVDRQTWKSFANGSAQNGLFKVKPSDSTADSSRSSSVSALACKSHRSGAQTAVSSASNVLSTGNSIVMERRRNYQLQGLSSSALASWHLISS